MGFWGVYFLHLKLGKTLKWIQWFGYMNRRKEERQMLEHPQITWILETGYPSWLQPGKGGENDGLEENER